MLEPGPFAATEARAALERLYERLPAQLYLDLRIVVTELITNAVKFGPEQPIVLAIRIRRDGTVSGEVSDGGSGGVELRPRPAARGRRHGAADRRRPDRELGGAAALDRRLVRARVVARSAGGVVRASAVLVLLSLAAGAQPASAAKLSCGETIKADTKLGNDLNDCENNGIVIGADGVTLDLNGHTVDGDDKLAGDCGQRPCDNGVLALGHDDVVVKAGKVRQFGTGVVVAASRGRRRARRRRVGQHPQRPARLPVLGRPDRRQPLDPKWRRSRLPGDRGRRSPTTSP